MLLIIFVIEIKYVGSRKGDKTVLTKNIMGTFVIDKPPGSSTILLGAEECLFGAIQKVLGRCDLLKVSTINC